VSEGENAREEEGGEGGDDDDGGEGMTDDNDTKNAWLCEWIVIQTADVIFTCNSISRSSDTASFVSFF